MRGMHGLLDRAKATYTNVGFRLDGGRVSPCDVGRHVEGEDVIVCKGSHEFSDGSIEFGG